jgi:putative transcriptional regulator
MNNIIVSEVLRSMESNISWLIKKAGLKQYELAERLEISPQQLNAWATGKSYPRIDKAIKLAKILNCSLDELYTKDE